MWTRIDSGEMMMINGTVVKHWFSETLVQNTSDARTEYGRSRVLRSRNLGVTTQVRVWTDSNAAKAIASRRGPGKTRHQVGKSKDEANPRRTEPARPSDEAEGMASD